MWVHMLAARLLRPRFQMAVAALVFDDQKRVLLFKHTYRKFPWGIPVGGLEYQEQPEGAVAREILEESGIVIQAERLLLADSSKWYPHVTLIYLCRIISGEFRESDEVSEMKYFDVNGLPAMIFDEKDLILTFHKALFEHELA